MKLTPHLRTDVYALKSVAATLRQSADQAEKMVAALNDLPQPIGECVEQLAEQLRWHGICLVHVDVLRRARQCLETMEAEDCDHPLETGEEFWKLKQSIEEAINHTPTRDLLEKQP